MKNRTYSRKQLAEKASLTDEDLTQINQCRRPHNRLGFGCPKAHLHKVHGLSERLPIGNWVTSTEWSRC